MPNAQHRVYEKSHMTPNEFIIYKQGYKAAQDGIRQKHCPYDEHTSPDYYDAWIVGYHDCRFG